MWYLKDMVYWHGDNGSTVGLEVFSNLNDSVLLWFCSGVNLDLCFAGCDGTLMSPIRWNRNYLGRKQHSCSFYTQTYMLVYVFRQK